MQNFDPTPWVVGGTIAVITIVVLVILLARAITTAIRVAEEGRVAQRTQHRRLEMHAPNAPAPEGTSKGHGGMRHYDERNRLIGWEEWEYPAEPPAPREPDVRFHRREENHEEDEHDRAANGR